MTKKHAVNMWKRYLLLLSRTDDSRIIQNPTIQFTKNAKAGIYDCMSDMEYNVALKDVEEEAVLFRKESRSSACTLFFRGMQKISLTNEEIIQIAKVLAAASERVDFRHVFPASASSANGPFPSADELPD